jgi:RNA polymerase sigma-70 factor (ECF subfamily)
LSPPESSRPIGEPVLDATAPGRARAQPTGDELTALLLAAREGDRLALGAFIRRTQADVQRLCGHLVDRVDAEDVTQDVYLRMWRALPSYRGEAAARVWLFGIARRACADAVRGRLRRRRLVAPTTARPVPDPAGAVGTAQLVAGLADDQRTAFALTQIVGLSYAEAAEACGCPVGTIRSRVARARVALVDELHEGFEGAAEGDR